MSVPYTFRRAVADDIPMLLHWLATPEVRRWWDDPSLLLENLREPQIATWIVAHDERSSQS